MEKNTPSNLSDVTKVWFSCITGHTGVQVYCDSISMLEIEDQDRKIEQEETGTVSSSVQPEVKCISLAKGSPDFKREGSTIQLCSRRKKVKEVVGNQHWWLQQPTPIKLNILLYQETGFPPWSTFIFLFPIFNFPYIMSYW